MRVAIGGSSGMLGRRLSDALRDRGDEVVKLVRRPPVSPDEIEWSPESGIIKGPGLDEVDAVVNLAGASIAGKRWTEKYKQEILRSRVSTTQTVVRALQIAHYEELDDSADTSGNKVEFAGRCKVFLSANAIGYYGYDRGSEVLTEGSTQGTGFLARVCEKWQAAARPAEDLGVRVVYLRTANVLAPDSGLMKLLKLPFKLGLGGRFGSGNQWFSWITAEDHVRAMLFLLDHEISGPVNLSAPDPVINEEFVKEFARSLHRPAAIPLPLAPMGLVLTPEMVRETISASQRVLPDVLERHGFKFNQPTYADALAWMQS